MEKAMDEYSSNACVDKAMDEYICKRDENDMPDNIWREYKRNARIILYHMDSLSTSKSTWEKAAIMDVIYFLKNQQTYVLNKYRDVLNLSTC
jgi:hypothetical protein